MNHWIMHFAGLKKMSKMLVLSEARKRALVKNHVRRKKKVRGST